MCCNQKAWAACAQSFTLWQQATIEIMHRNHSVRTLVMMFNHSHVSISRESMLQSLYYCLFVHGCHSSRTSHSWWITHSTQCQHRGCNNPSILQRTTLIPLSFCEDCTWHDLHILVTAPFCCDRKAQAACTQSFTLWQPATINLIRHNHAVYSLVIIFNRSHLSICKDAAITILLLARATYIWVLLFAHILFVADHTFNATPTERLQQIYYYYYRFLIFYPCMPCTLVNTTGSLRSLRLLISLRLLRSPKLLS